MIAGIVAAGELRFGALVILARMAAVIGRKVALAILASKGLPAVIPCVRTSVIASAVAVVAAGRVVVVSVVVVMVVIDRAATTIATTITPAVIAAAIVAATVTAAAPSAIQRRPKIHTR